MPDKIQNESRSLEISFGDSAKHFVQEYCKGTMPVEEAANSLIFIYRNIRTLSGKQFFVRDLQAFVKKCVEEQSIDDEKTTSEKASKLYNALILAIKEAEQPSLTREMGVRTRDQVKKVIH